MLRVVTYMRCFCVYFAVPELRPKLEETVDSSPMLRSWMVYALAFSIVYSLIAWPCVIRVCRKPSADADWGTIAVRKLPRVYTCTFYSSPCTQKHRRPYTETDGREIHNCVIPTNFCIGLMILLPYRDLSYRPICSLLMNNCCTHCNNLRNMNILHRPLDIYQFLAYISTIFLY